MNWPLFQNSLLVCLGATLLALLLGLAAALCGLGLPPRARTALAAFAAVALALPPFLVTNAWIELLGQTGTWRPWLNLTIYSLPGTTWVLALLLWPIPFFLTQAAWTPIPPSLLESDDALAGASLLRWTLIPASAGALQQAALLCGVLALGNVAVPAILQVKVFPAELWVRFNTSFDFAGAALLGIPLVLPPLALVLWLRRHPVQWPRLETSLPPGLARRRLGTWWWSATGCSALLLVLSVALPLLQLAGAQRTWSEFPGAWAAGGSAFRMSLQCAASTATLAVALGFALWQRPAAQTLWLLWLLPGVFLGMACIFAFNRWPLTPFYQSSAVVIFALALRYVAITWQAARWTRAALDADLDDAARVDGASAWQRLRWVRWPQLAIPLAVTWYIVYLLTLWDVETILLIVPPGGETLALRIFNLLHYGHNAQVDALCIILLAIALAPLVGWQAARACGLARLLRIPA